jgi:hypothetical protein
MVKDGANIFELEKKGENLYCSCEYLDRTALPCRHLLRAIIISKKSIMRIIPDRWRLKDNMDEDHNKPGREKSSRRNRLK